MLVIIEIFSDFNWSLHHIEAWSCSNYHRNLSKSKWCSKLLQAWQQCWQPVLSLASKHLPETLELSSWWPRNPNPYHFYLSHQISLAWPVTSVSFATSQFDEKIFTNCKFWLIVCENHCTNKKLSKPHQALIPLVSLTKLTSAGFVRPSWSTAVSACLLSLDLWHQDLSSSLEMCTMCQQLLLTMPQWSQVPWVRSFFGSPFSSFSQQRSSARCLMALVAPQEIFLSTLLIFTSVAQRECRRTWRSRNWRMVALPWLLSQELSHKLSSLAETSHLSKTILP